MQGNYTKIIDEYQKLRSDREQKAQDFVNGKRSYLIYQASVKRELYTDSDSKEICFDRSINYISKCLQEKSDHVPAMQPWFGTGVYANMYGCKYIWRKGEAPATNYIYHSLNDIAGIKKPKWENSVIAQMVMDTIKYFKSKTGDSIPITWTDTQSAHDTATLVLDATEILMGCLTEPRLVINFMNDINDLIIEFSQAQADLIGDALIRPGHVMYSAKSFGGISISDDNLGVVSPQIAKDINLPLNEKVGKAMGGFAVHSCGTWTKIMKFIPQVSPSCMMVHCSLTKDWDTAPNKPEDVRDAMKGTGIPAHVRVPADTSRMLETVKRVIDPDLKLIVQPQYVDEETAERNYHELNNLLKDFYG